MKKPTTGGGGFRTQKQRVKTAKGRKTSSRLWLQRQLNDPYVQRARAEGMRGRAAYKLAELDEMHELIPRGGVVVDLGSAPGGWLQVAAKKVGPKGRVVGIDLQEIDSVPGTEFLQADFMSDEGLARLEAMLGDVRADAVVSDMAAAATGHQKTDHLRTMALGEAAAAFAHDWLKPGGNFAAKVLRGGGEKDLMDMLKRDFTWVKHVKPPSSRSDSSELFVLAKGFRGRQEQGGDEAG
ncbi:MAG: RlmE family RNA methyltransferase [Pseudomonadota bacterium]